MDYEQTMQFILEYCAKGETRHEKSKMFPAAIIAAVQKNAPIFSDLAEIREITQYITHIAERGEKKSTSFENTMGAIRASSLYLLLMYGESKAVRRNMIDSVMKKLRHDYPLPDPYRVPVIDLEDTSL